MFRQILCGGQVCEVVARGESWEGATFADTSASCSGQHQYIQLRGITGTAPGIYCNYNYIVYLLSRVKSRDGCSGPWLADSRLCGQTHYCLDLMLAEREEVSRSSTVCACSSANHHLLWRSHDPFMCPAPLNHPSPDHGAQISCSF